MGCPKTVPDCIHKKNNNNNRGSRGAALKLDKNGNILSRVSKTSFDGKTYIATIKKK